MEGNKKNTLLPKTINISCIAWTICPWTIIGMLVIQVGSRLYTTPVLQKENSLSRTTLPYMYNNKQGRNALVDMIRSEHRPMENMKGRSILRILFINKPTWVNISKVNAYFRNKCTFKNCIMTDVVKNISQMSAVVFSAQDRLKYGSSYLKRNRPYSQVWVFFRFETPVYENTVWYRDLVWTNTMNWSWGYRLDSDIFRPIQIITTKSVLGYRDYDTIFKRKKKVAAWAESNCHTKSLRSEYVRALIREGVQVDIFGKCSKNMINQKDFHQRLNDDYKFFLSFENSFCKDYVTEKFFKYLGLDTVLVVRGGINYSEHFNQNAFIDTSSFPTVKSLASYILRISQNKQLYTGYLRNKDMYNIAGSQENSLMESACDLCEKINNQERYRNTYENIAIYLHNGTCFNPDKIL